MTRETLIQMLISYPEYRKLYIGYKVMVEHRNIPSILFKDLPQQLGMELRINYEKEKEKFLKKKY